MRASRLFYGRQQECEILYSIKVNNIWVDVVKYLYKGKDPVYYVFEQKPPHKPLLVALDLSTVNPTIQYQLSKRGPEKRPKFNFIKLKILKII